MKLELIPPTEIEQKRAAWFAAHAKPEMTMGKYFQLNEEVHRLYPRTDEERRQKAEAMANMPEFVL
jgi:hypothetical protein